VDEQDISSAPQEEREKELIDESEDISSLKTEEDLLTCCIDSLAMGLGRCEICGRNLEGKDQEFAKGLQQRRKQQLKEELLHGKAQVGFSEEQLDTEVSTQVSAEEDFSDVERALDALADGSFQEAIKKREAKKTVAKTLKKILGFALVLLVVVGGIIWYILPSSHEKLLSRYEQLMSQTEVDPRALVKLFLDAVIKQDNEIFQRLSVIQTMPNITYGKIISVGDEYEETSLGIPGEMILTLEQKIATLEKQMEQKTELLKEYTSKTLSPRLIEESIKIIEKKIEVLNAEFENKDAEIAKKLVSLQRDLEKTEQDIVKNRQMSRKYVDDVTKIGKALYKNSLMKQKLLAEQKENLELRIQQETTEYQKRRQGLEAEYQPQFSRLEERLENEKSRLREARLLEDAEKSPVTTLSKELEQMTKTIIDKKNTLEETKEQLKTALTFFTRANERDVIAKKQNVTEFVHVSRNVAASIKFGGSAEQKTSIVLKRYQAIIADKTFQSDWLVENIAK
jgi:hypothetical protein